MSYIIRLIDDEKKTVGCIREFGPLYYASITERWFSARIEDAIHFKTVDDAVAILRREDDVQSFDRGGVAKLYGRKRVNYSADKLHVLDCTTGEEVHHVSLKDLERQQLCGFCHRRDGRWRLQIDKPERDPEAIHEMVSRGVYACHRCLNWNSRGAQARRKARQEAKQLKLEKVQTKRKAKLKLAKVGEAAIVCQHEKQNGKEDRRLLQASPPVREEDCSSL